MALHDADKLNALFVKKIDKTRKYSDRLGLYLFVWVLGGKRPEQRLTIKVYHSHAR